MRLTEAQKSLVLEAALRHMVDPCLVRAGEAWAVVGKSEPEDGPKVFWKGFLVSKVDSDGRVWWTEGTRAARRKDVTRALGVEPTWDTTQQ